MRIPSVVVIDEEGGDIGANLSAAVSAGKPWNHRRALPSARRLGHINDAAIDPPSKSAITARETRIGTRYSGSPIIFTPTNASTSETPSFRYTNFSINEATTK